MGTVKSVMFIVFVADYGRKLADARGDLVQSMKINDCFLTHMMYGEVLSMDSKRDILTVSQPVCVSALTYCSCGLMCVLFVLYGPNTIFGNVLDEFSPKLQH